MRESGFYWVDADWITDWTIAEWRNDNWHITGSDDIYFDFEFDEIKENRIVLEG